MKRFHCIIFYLSVQLIAMFYKYWFLLIFVSIITITIIIIIIIIIIIFFLNQIFY